ncbi:hypothetical protein, partial [Roseomonas chloroacetimidivorans]|uniref:hypothetical protein n=1 Tax=Roseomonas chloroacetimidivorans TaxID=1766656 RepID=UPI003C7676DE
DDILKGGAGNDTIVFNNGALTAGDTVDGGAGYDAIRLLGGGTLADAAFTQVSNIEGISIGAGTYSLTLGEEAKAAFTDGNVRVAASGATSVSLDAGSLGIDGYRFSFTGSGGADTVVIGGNVATITGGAGADSFVLTPEAFYAATITDFQDGIDHLVIDDALIPASLDTP